jgi:hypothetical protein
MQTLGLSSEVKRSDGRLKSLLWPTVDNAWDVDYLGQQGMWICTVVAVFTLVTSLLSANPIVIAVGLLAALFFVVGGMGIRECNWPAAAIVLAVHLCNILLAPNVFSILFGVVLLSNLRATFLAAEWKPAEEGEDRPTRFNDSLADKYIDQWPRLLWPRLQIPFLILGVSMLLLSLFGIAFTLANRFGLIPHK